MFVEDVTGCDMALMGRPSTEEDTGVGERVDSPTCSEMGNYHVKNIVFKIPIETSLLTH